MLEYGRARREEEPDILDFANMVFSLNGRPVDFRRVQPKVYTKPGFADISQVARENGRIRGLVNAVHGTLILGDERLRYGYVGTVSAHPYERGRGIMKTLMELTHRRLADEGCQFLALGGQRQRYGFFGYENAGAVARLGFTDASIRHTLGDSNDNLHLVPMDESALGMVKALHEKRPLRAERGMWDLALLLRTEEAQPYAVLRGNVPIGYLAAQGGDVWEFACVSDADAPAAVAEFMRHTGRRDAQVSFPLHELRRYPELMAAADDWHVGQSCMVSVLDWQGFLTALLRFAAKQRDLMTGETVLGIRGHGNFWMRVEGKDAQVVKTDAPAVLTLSGKDTVALLTLSVGSALRPDHLFLNWLPLPFYMSELDSF